jgi:hypothetical protein
MRTSIMKRSPPSGTILHRFRGRAYRLWIIGASGQGAPRPPSRNGTATVVAAASSAFDGALPFDPMPTYLQLLCAAQ